MNSDGSGKMMSGKPNRHGRSTTSLEVTLVGGDGTSNLRSSVDVRMFKRLSQIKEYAALDVIRKTAAKCCSNRTHTCHFRSDREYGVLGEGTGLFSDVTFHAVLDYLRRSC